MIGIFLDSETSGLNPFRHNLLEIAFELIDLESNKTLASFDRVVFTPSEKWVNYDPDSLKVNGFTYEEVARGEKPEVIAQEITALFQAHGIRRGKAVFICQNPSFDRPFFSHLIPPETQEKLNWPYHWLDLASMYWVEALRKGKKNPKALPWETGCSKDKIASVYGIPPEEKPHRAGGGVRHLVLCYQAVVGS